MAHDCREAIEVQSALIYELPSDPGVQRALWAVNNVGHIIVWRKMDLKRPPLKHGDRLYKIHKMELGEPSS